MTDRKPRSAPLTRRAWLAATAAAGVVACSSDKEKSAKATEDIPPGEPWELEPTGVAESREIFPRTVLAGDMGTDFIVLAIFIADKRPKTLRIWRLDDQRIIEERSVTPDENGFAKERIEGLRAGISYQYGYFDGTAPDFSARSLIGNFRTLPKPGVAQPVTVAFGSCVGHNSAIPDFVKPPEMQPFPWDLTKNMADKDFDLFVHLGDQGYMDDIWDAGGSYELYLQAWGAYHGGGFRDVYPKAAVISTWDDHEVTDNSKVEPFTTDPEELEKMDNAKRAYYRVMPIDGDDYRTDRIWRSFRFGDTLEMVLLDCRYELQPEEDGRLISDEQMAWLLDILRTSPCRFICIGTDKPFANVMLEGEPYFGAKERWQGHLGDRDRVTGVIDELGMKNLIFVTGDIHMNYVGTLDEEPDSVAGELHEVCCTSGNTNPLTMFLSKKQFEFTAVTAHMPLLTFDPAAGTITVRFYSDDGELAFEKVIDA